MQQLIQGAGSIQDAVALIGEKKIDKLFLVTGKHFADHHRLNIPSSIAVTHFIKKGTNVEQNEITEALAAFTNSDASAIMAIGGGSVMDLAKAVIWQNSAAGKPLPFFLAAPTTAGSGSEATSFAVVYKNGKKESLVAPSLQPAIAILDPELTYTLGAYQTAVSGMDVLAQAVESYWNKNANAESRGYASEAIETWKDSFQKVVADGNDTMARASMLHASYLAGKAINITRTTGPHAMSYYLTSQFNVPHGQAVALFLPAFFLYNPAQPGLYALLGVDDPTMAAQWVREQMKDAGLAVSLHELGIKKEDILDELLDDVNEERFANNPAPFQREALKTLLSSNI